MTFPPGCTFVLAESIVPGLVDIAALAGLREYTGCLYIFDRNFRKKPKELSRLLLGVVASAVCV